MSRMSELMVKSALPLRRVKDGQIILLLRGQPVWSYLYRKMIPLLTQNGFRCFAPDMIGMGKSDKPIKESFIAMIGIVN